MMSWINQHSFLILMVAVSILAVVMTSAIGRPWLRGIVLGAVAITVVVGYVALATGTSTHTTEGSVVATLNSGVPTLLEFYSDY